MRRGMVLSILAGMALLAPGAGGQPAGNSGPQDFDNFKIVQVGGSAPVVVDVDKAADMLAAYDVIFVGEYHDHLANHLAEMSLLRALHRRAPNLALSMEQFERDTQPAVDDYLAGRTGEATLKRIMSAAGMRAL